MVWPQALGLHQDLLEGAPRDRPQEGLVPRSGGQHLAQCPGNLKLTGYGCLEYLGFVGDLHGALQVADRPLHSRRIRVLAVVAPDQLQVSAQVQEHAMASGPLVERPARDDAVERLLRVVIGLRKVADLSGHGVPVAERECHGG